MIQFCRSVLFRISEYLADCSKVILLPAVFNLFLLLASRNIGLCEIDIALVFIAILKHNLDG